MFVILPFLLVAISYGGWWLITYKGRKSGHTPMSVMRTKVISTMVILLFFVHPNIVKQVFQTFYCLDIDGTQRLKYDLEITCYTGGHKFWSYFIALPGMIWWGFGIPLFAFYLLARERDKIERLEVR